MKVIVIIHDGIVSGARTDIAEPLEVEVLDIDKDYEDYERLKEYEDQLYTDPSLREKRRPHNSPFRCQGRRMINRSRKFSFTPARRRIASVISQ